MIEISGPSFELPLPHTISLYHFAIHVAVRVRVRLTVYER